LARRLDRAEPVRPAAGELVEPGRKNPYRLDHALLSPVAPRATGVRYLTQTDDGDCLTGAGRLSDHAALVVDLPTVG
jgi:hypothetical protein